MKLIQDDYDDGFQELVVIEGERRWEERRLYISKDGFQGIDVYYALRESGVDDAIIYKAICKISKVVKTTKPKYIPVVSGSWPPPSYPATYS